MVSSSSFSLSVATAPSTVVHDLVWHNWDWGWGDVFSTADGWLDGAWGTSPPFLRGEKKFGCSDVGKDIPLFVIVAVLVSDSTGFCALPGAVGDTEICFSSNFPVRTNAGPGPPFMPWEWSKLSPILWLFLCLIWKRDCQLFGCNLYFIHQYALSCSLCREFKSYKARCKRHRIQ